MFINQVEAFVNVVKYKSFSQAARKLYLSQPTISSHIKSLEAEFGVQLLVRTTKDVVLSDAGKIFYDYALELIHIRDVAYMKMKAYTNEIKGNLRLAASTVPAQYILPELLESVRKENTDIQFTINEMDSQSVISCLDRFDADLGFTGMSLPDSRINFIPIVEDRLVLITPNTAFYRHFEGKFPINLITKTPFVWRTQGSGTRRAASLFLDSIGIDETDLNIVSEMPSTESIKQAVFRNLGLSFISRKAAEDYVKFGYLLEFDFDSDLLNRSIYVAHHKNIMFSPTADYFFDFIKKHYHIC